MINEILELSKSLDRCQISVPTECHWIQRLRKAEALIVRVGMRENRASVIDVEHCDAERAGLLWTVRKNKFNAFPGFNIYGPIYSADPDDSLVRRLLKDRLTPVEIATCLSDIMSRGKLVFDKSQAKSLWNQIYAFPHEELLPLIANASPEYRAFGALIEVFAGMQRFEQEEIGAFVRSLACVAVEHCRDGRFDQGATLLKDLIVGKWDEHKMRFKKPLQGVSVFFDLADYALLGDPAPVKLTDERMAEFVSRQLLARTKVTDAADFGICSLTGDSGPIEKGKLPDPRFPIIGNAYLMSMDKNAFCHDRYGMASTTTVFPMGKAVLQRMTDALGSKGITRSDRKGKTWIGVPSGKWDRQGKVQKPKVDLLLSYVEEMPNEDFENARLLGGTERTTQTDFESLAGTVCDALKNKTPITENQHLRLLLIRRISKGQAQLVLTERLTVQSLFDSVRRWREASRNCPHFSLPMPPSVKGEKAVATEPHCPFPSEMIELLQYQWIRGGTENHKLEGCKLGEIFDLFFGQERARNITSSLLEKVLQRISPLLLGIGLVAHTNWRSDEDRKAFDVDARKTVLKTFVMLGILLFELGRKKEEYMKDAAFGVGQLLSLADTLHKDYCIAVRGGSLPPSVMIR